jgi:hypothetical protein
MAEIWLEHANIRVRAVFRRLMLVALSFEAVMARVPLPGTVQIPAVHAIRSLLALKLFGRARSSRGALSSQIIGPIAGEAEESVRGEIPW